MDTTVITVLTVSPVQFIYTEWEFIDPQELINRWRNQMMS